MERTDMKLWIDDLRTAPEGWLWAVNSKEAIACLSQDEFDFTEISFDHDLGGDDTVRPVILWLCENDCWPAIVRVHTANPVGRDWIVGMCNRYGPGVTV